MKNNIILIFQKPNKRINCKNKTFGEALKFGKMKIICIWLELWKKLRVGRPTSHKVDGGPLAISWKMKEKSKEKMKEMREKTVGNQ